MSVPFPRRPSTHPSPVRMAGALLVLLPLHACDARGGARTQGVVRDSAGVAVVVHGEDAPAPLVLDGEPDVVIGGQGAPPYELARVGAIQPLPSGNVVLSELASGELRFYGPEGAHIRSVSGQGGGPAGFTRLVDLWTYADTLAGADRALFRLLRFDTAGTFRSATSYSPDYADMAPREGEVCAPPALAGLLADGARVVWGWRCVPGDRDGGLRRYRARLQVARSGEAAVVDTFDAGIAWGTDPSPDRWLEAPFRAGATVAVAGDRIYVTRGQDYRIEVYDGQGRLVKILAEEGAPPPVTEADREAFFETAPKGYPPDTPFPERFPAYVQLLYDRNGELWALRHPAGADEERQLWTVFSADGTERRRVELPAASWRAVGDGRVWGVRELVHNVLRVLAYDAGG